MKNLINWKDLGYKMIIGLLLSAAVITFAFFYYSVNLTPLEAEVMRVERLEKFVKHDDHVAWMEEMQERLDSLKIKADSLEFIKAEQDSLIQVNRIQLEAERKMRQDKLQEIRKEQARVNRLK